MGVESCCFYRLPHPQIMITWQPIYLDRCKGRVYVNYEKVYVKSNNRLPLLDKDVGCLTYFIRSTLIKAATLPHQ